jgi:hypothetical protein
MNIVFDDIAHKWTIATKPGYPQTFEAEFTKNQFTTKYPIGRKKWLYNDPICQLQDQHALTVSICDFPTQFTCDSGHCIGINKRCDEHEDCLDGSDEKLCYLISIPPSYNRANAPAASEKNLILEIMIQTKIISIDSIDTVNMIVTLTMELQITWFDKRLMFSNPMINRDNLIPGEMAKKLWTPLRDLIHENAIIGEITYDSDFSAKLLPSVPENLELSKHIENRLFNGSYNSLQLTQRMRIKYNCIFDVKKFPFDSQNCTFIMKINQLKDKPITFVNDGNVVYDGLPIVDQFFIGSITNEVKNTNESTNNMLVIQMSRMYTNQLTITFVPTFILWLFGYITLFIEPDGEGFSDRFIGAGTALLVIATLLNAISSDLPKTSYMKYIDVWFVYHVISIFSMIAYHIVLNRCRTYFSSRADEDVMMGDDFATLKRNGKKKITQINNALIIAFPAVNGVFYAIYFFLTLD